MALYQVASGASIVILDINQFYALLTGTMTDQPVTLNFISTAQSTGGMGLVLQRAGTSDVQGLALSNGVAVDVLIWRKSSDDSLYVSKYGGSGSPTDLLKIDASGNVTATGAVYADGGIQTINSGISTTGGGVLSISGATTLSSTLGVTGATTLSGGATIPDAQTITFGGASGRIFEIGQFSVSYSNNGNPSTFDNLALQLNYHGRSIYVVACPVAGSPNPTTVMASQGTNPNTAKLQVTSGGNTSLTFNYIAAG